MGRHLAHQILDPRGRHFPLERAAECGRDNHADGHGLHMGDRRDLRPLGQGLGHGGALVASGKTFRRDDYEVDFIHAGP
jgi:hypothetical protein